MIRRNEEAPSFPVEYRVHRLFYDDSRRYQCLTDAYGTALEWALDGPDAPILIERRAAGAARGTDWEPFLRLSRPTPDSSVVVSKMQPARRVAKGGTP